MLSSYYKKFYALQDEVLDHIRNLNTPFYLTGGTALSRFFLNHRYSDDLDLFVNFHPDFEKQADKVKNCLTEIYGEAFRIQIDQDYFKRFFISKSNRKLELKIELINDVPFRTGDLWGNEIYDKIDSWRNILANKVGALSRNEERDLVDLLFLSYKFEFNWMEVIEDARQKDDWVEEIKISKYLHDVEYLSSVKFIDETMDLNNILPDFKIIAREILKGENNTLCKKE